MKIHTPPVVTLTLLLLSLFACTVFAIDEQELTEKLFTHFTAEKPTAVMKYKVTYHLLRLKLLSIATATIEATEGRWHYAQTGSNTACCLIDMTLLSMRHDEKAKKKGRIYINDRILTVATMPDLNTIYYIKRTDEYINPPFKKDKRVDSLAVYDLEHGGLDYYERNYLTGTVQTNVSGASDMVKQGREVSAVLQLLSEVYTGRRESITPDSDFRIQVNCDGVAIPFAARTKRGQLKIMGKRWPILIADVMPAKEAPKIKSRKFRMWVTSFSEVAGQLDDPVLKQLADEAPVWGMTPLLIDYGLTLGSIRCAITTIETKNQSEFTPILLTCSADSSDSERTVPE